MKKILMTIWALTLGGALAVAQAGSSSSGQSGKQFVRTEQPGQTSTNPAV